MGPTALGPDLDLAPSPAESPAKDYQYPPSPEGNVPETAAAAAAGGPAPPTLINLDGGTVTLGQWRQERVPGELISKFYTGNTGNAPAQLPPVPVVSAAPSPAPVAYVPSPAPSAFKPAAAPSPLPAPLPAPVAAVPSPAPGLELSSEDNVGMPETELDYENDVTAWQDPLLEGTFAPVDDEKKESMAIWYVYTACWLGILGFWAYYYMRGKK